MAVARVRKSITPGQPASQCARRMWCLPSSSCSASRSSWVGASSSAAASPPAARRMAAASAVCVSPVPGAQYCGVRAQPSGDLETGSVKSSGAAAARQRRWERHLRRKRLALFLFDHGLLLCRVLASDDVTETHPAALVDLERRSLFSLACTPPEGREGATAARLSYGGITARGAVGGAYQPGTVLANVGIGPCLFRPRRTRAESAPPAGRAVLLPLHPSRSGVDTLQRGPCVVDPAASWDPLRHERRRGAA